MSDRSLSPVLGVVLLVAITATLAGVVGSVALGTDVPTDSTTAALDLRTDADANRVTLVHRGGEALDVTDLTVRIAVDGRALDAQPPVPFFSAPGFRPGPTGPFNSATDREWTAGERASVRLAQTNDPLIAPGASVSVTLSADGRVLAELDATA
ncbi:type IV pilin [Halorussus halobius]|uniref:type IV pilin n=1 Tax=Halorussus halobius TaxID=1710537 RepID=UPI001091A0BD|nr:type IV pilin N-terminal domain-containing protein [Halorussus halobius]